MEKAKVYFADFRATLHENLQQKLTRLMKAAGADQIDFDKKFTAIKLHFGEPGNLAFLRPNWAKTVADFVRARGGRPFLTDCNTLYVGGRKNALDHLDSAYLNGFSPFSTGCHVIIADGLKGTDEAYVPVEGGEYVKEAKIGQAIMDADVFISLNHFKGHENAGFGGALKNIGMGCGSRAGKMSSTTRASRRSIRAPAWAAACAPASARTAPSPSRTKRRISTTTNASAAAAASACARPTRSAAALTSPISCSTARSRNTPRRSWTAGVLPHLTRHRRVAQLRLPRGKRRGHRAEHRHVCVV